LEHQEKRERCYKPRLEGNMLLFSDIACKPCQRITQPLSEPRWGEFSALGLFLVLEITKSNNLPNLIFEYKKKVDGTCLNSPSSRETDNTIGRGPS
jgi:hypothetical protein